MTVGINVIGGHGWSDVWVPAVVPLGRFVPAPLGVIKVDSFHRVLAACLRIVSLKLQIRLGPRIIV